MSSVQNREKSPPDARSERQDALYADAAAGHGGMIARLCAGYEADPALREDLEQEIHLQLWRSFASFAGQCSIATWVHRIAHNVGARHVHRAVRLKPGAQLHSPARPNYCSTSSPDWNRRCRAIPSMDP